MRKGIWVLTFVASFIKKMSVKKVALLSPFWQKLYKRRENANVKCSKSSRKSMKSWGKKIVGFFVASWMEKFYDFFIRLVSGSFHFSFFGQSDQKRKNQLSCLFIFCIKNPYFAWKCQLIFSIFGHWPKNKPKNGINPTVNSLLLF